MNRETILNYASRLKRDANYPRKGTRIDDVAVIRLKAVLTR